MNQMCFIGMQDALEEKNVHFFTIELRTKEAKNGMYFYSSWAQLFSLKWFLNFDENMRSTFEESRRKNAVSAAKTLKNECGAMQFIEFEKFEKCLEYFFSILYSEFPSEITDLKFVFGCRPLNSAFQELKHD